MKEKLRQKFFLSGTLALSGIAEQLLWDTAGGAKWAVVPCSDL